MLPTLATLFLALQETVPPTGSEGGDGGGSGMWLPLVAMGAIFYFLLIAPERKQRKQRQAMLDAIQKDDRVIILSYAQFDESEAGGHRPSAVIVGDDNQVIQRI